ncbi:unnamed protein product [Sympodiomycopsis kandeliae]
MLGDQALKLIIEARNVDATGSFKPYNEEIVRLVLLETRQLNEEIGNILSTVPGGAAYASEAAENDPKLAAQLLTHHLTAQRNKRCLLAYHQHRMDWLKQRFWDRGASIALLLEERDDIKNSSTTKSSSSTDLRSKLSPNELNWLREYSSLVTAYKSEYLDILDVALPLSLSRNSASIADESSSSSSSSAARGQHFSLDFKPPDELMVTVIATRDARDVMTEMGTLNLRKGERMRLRRMEVEGLIVRGWLSVVD